MNANNNNGIIITNKTTRFTLVARPELPPKGRNSGLITVVEQLTGTDKGKEINRMDITVQLDAKDSKGQPFILTRSYNLGENGRGLGLFLKDYCAISGVKLTITDLYDFNPESLKGTRVFPEVEFSQVGKEVTAVMKGFLPPEIETKAATH